MSINDLDEKIYWHIEENDCKPNIIIVDNIFMEYINKAIKLNIVNKETRFNDIRIISSKDLKSNEVLIF